ncbi:MAG: short-chain dehydrogenase, partial [Mycobacterium sp.]|nr:short-chain dehydrogenase [Mycobacterium sp.]
VPPIYQPEVAARGVLHALDHPRRKQYWVGASTVGTIAGQRLVPALLDRYLARTGFDSQQTDQGVSPERPANLWEPADGPTGRDYGAHGVFGDRSQGHSVQFWATRHRRSLIGAGLAATMLAASNWGRRQLQQ